MALAKPEISADQTERKAQELLNEWLKSYFSGLPVMLSGSQITLPVCELLFNQAAEIQEQDEKGNLKPVIHTIFSDLHPEWTPETETQKLVTSPLTLTFFVRVAKPIAGFQTADFACRFISDSLKRMFETERLDLAKRGMRQFRIRRGPVPLATPGVATRTLSSSCILYYRTGY